MKMILVRHGQSNYNLKDLCNGLPSKKVYLTPLGKKQASEVALKLAKKKIDVIYISKLFRSEQTAKIINRYHKVKMIADKRLNDRLMGEFENKSAALFYAWRDKSKEPWAIAPKGGESYIDLEKRVKLFLNDLIAKDYKTVLVVSHLTVIAVIQGYFKRLSNRTIDRLNEKDIPNCKVVIVDLPKKAIKI
ncbi:MAG: histidine phosphatase family protein [Candidatus Falkowbacteria bacterium]|nr:histidine phosphatase family protein [Candidatus Falkowbacteria bacterium]